MTTKYQATAPDGTVFRRSTKSRKYTHCVVRWLPARPPAGRLPGREEQWSDGEWRRTRQLAEALANTYRGHGRALQVLVLEAVEVETKQAAAKRAADRVADHVDGYDRDDLGESQDY
jgi:hypothetical protein